MLTLTPTASEAVNALLASPELPDTSGVRLEPGTDPAGQPAIGVSVVEAPADGDRLVPAGQGNDIYLSPEVVDWLDDQVLDAEVHDAQVAFTIRPKLGADARPVA
jgi:Fe-S cluster assembly iron-binding protein IscA